MSDVWRICVVESDASLNQNLVNALRKDGYVVQGVMKSADAMRVLWSEEYDVVICDLNLSGTDGFELLRWLRAYRSNVRPIVLGDPTRAGDSAQRLQALESGAISYIQKPIDLRLLKDELHRLLQQTGFTASLDSFDLLDVIQMIAMSRKSIALLISTGLEERGMLRFHNGDLAWAEYGVLRGEEAFFALAAHKNGTVTQQVSNEPLVTNVTQPLSRLIFQALQYRTKYANTQQPGGEPVGQGQAAFGQGQAAFGQGQAAFGQGQAAFGQGQAAFGQGQTAFGQGQATFGQGQTPIGQGQAQSLRVDEIDDSPFVFTSEGMVTSDPGSVQQMPQVTHVMPAFSAPQGAQPPMMQMDLYASREAMNSSQSSSLLQGETSMAEKDASQMSFWLSDQPTSAQAPIRPSTPFSASKQGPVPPASLSGEMQRISASKQGPVPPTSLSGEIQRISASKQGPVPPASLSGEMQQISASKQGPVPPASLSGEMQQMQKSAQVPLRTTDQLPKSQQPAPQMRAFAAETEERRASSSQWSQEPQRRSSSPLHRLAGQSGVFERTQGRQNPFDALRESNPMQPSTHENNPMQPSTPPPQNQRQMTGENHAAIVSALQTFGYSLPGFIAAAVIDVDDHPLAQVAIDDADISQVWQLLGVVQRSVLDALQSDEWGKYEETVITTASRYVLMHVIGSDRKAFLVLITTREADSTLSLEIMANVESAVTAALC